MVYQNSFYQPATGRHIQDVSLKMDPALLRQLQSVVFRNRAHDEIELNGSALRGMSEAETLVLCNQVVELQLRLLLREVRDLAEKQHTVPIICTRLKKINRTVRSLIANFRFIATKASEVDHILFQPAFLPGGSFHTALLRYIEIYCTRPSNLGVAGASRQGHNEHPLEQVYWRHLDVDRPAPSGHRAFADNYLADLTALARRMRGRTIEENLSVFNKADDKLFSRLKEFDELFNVKLNTAHEELLKVWSHCGKAYGLEGLNPPLNTKRRFFPFAWQEKNTAVAE